MSGSHPAFSQSPLDNALRQHEKAVIDAQQRERPGVDIFTPDVPEATVLPQTQKESPCLEVKHIVLDGHWDGMGDKPEAILQRYIGPCLRASDLNELLASLNRWYQQRGWITTRVYAAEQTLSSGELRLLVVPGRVQGYLLNGEPASPGFLAAFPVRRGGLLNLRDLEQGLENVNRLPSQEGKFKLYPGKEPGKSEVAIELERKVPWRVTHVAENSGPKSMGVWRSNTELALDNLLGRHDQMAIGYNRNLQGGDLSAVFQGLTFNFLIPLGYHLFSTSASIYDSTFALPGINQSYDLKARSKKAGLAYEYLFHRNQSSKQSLISGLDVTRQNTRIGEIDIESQARRLSAAYLGFKGKHYVGNQVYDWMLRADRGLGIINAMGDIPGGTNPRYRLLKARINATVPLPGDRGLYRTTLQAQRGSADAPTLAQMYLGGRYDVRGFQDNSLYSPSGWYWRNELESKSWRAGLASFSVYTGLDAGKLKRNPAQELSQHHLSGAALGVRADMGPFKFDIAYTKALSRPSQFASESRDHWYAHLTLTF